MNFIQKLVLWCKSDTIKNIIYAALSFYSPYILEIAYIFELVSSELNAKLDQALPIISLVLGTLFSGNAFKHRVRAKTKFTEKEL